jgi:hypothetical protein
MTTNTQPLSADVDQILADFEPVFMEMAREKQEAVIEELRREMKSS